jgi:rod shape determining protein RodA
VSDFVHARAAARARRRESAETVPLVRRLDWTLALAVAALVAYGLWVIAGVTKHDVPGNETYYVVRQAIFAGIGAVLVLAFLLLDPMLFRRYKQPLYAVTVAAMAFVLIGGELSRGSTRWIDVGFFRFQPSEFGKLLFALFLAGFLADRVRRVGDVRTVGTACGLALVPIVLVFVQPDFGTALVYMAVLAAALFVAGVRWRHLAVLGILATLVALAALWWLPSTGVDVLKDYQLDRLTGFLDPAKDPGGTTYNITQSMTAVGAGGVRGRGVEDATQTRLDYLPEHSTDFVFASLAEQRGFLGAGFLLLLYLVVMWRGLKIVYGARDAFSAIAAGAIVMGFLFQVFVNVGMTIGIAPVTGIPLPFVSVGGSSMISNLAAMGVLLGIHARSRARRA